MTAIFSTTRRRLSATAEILVVKPPLAPARTAKCVARIHLFLHLSVCLSPKCKNAIFSKTKQFRAVVSSNNLYEVVHGVFKEPIIGPLKYDMTDIRHLENRHHVIFSAAGGLIWIKFRRQVQNAENDMSTARIWSKSKPEMEFQYDGRLGEFNGMSSREPHATTPNPDFKVRPFFDAEYLRNGYRYGHSYYGRQIGNRTQAFKWYHLQ